MSLSDTWTQTDAASIARDHVSSPMSIAITPDGSDGRGDGLGDACGVGDASGVGDACGVGDALGDDGGGGPTEDEGRVRTTSPATATIRVAATRPKLVNWRIVLPAR